MKHVSSTLSTVVDPVCGMSIDPATATGSSHYGERTYHFCSKGCEVTFAAEPAKYAESGSADSRAGSASCCSTGSGSSCC